MKLLYLILLFLLIQLCFCFDPITIGLTSAAVGYFGYNFDSVKKYTYCKMYECCIEDYIPADIIGLKEVLERKLFGQHILIEQLIPALNGHFQRHSKSKKPLVISFHGTPGTGKNFVADFIVKKLYKKGLQSKYVFKFLGRADFPLESRIDIYKDEINSKIRNAIQKCPYSLFIFDEVDKIPQGVFESITSLLDHHHNLNGIDYTKAIFIFMSNIAGLEISTRLGEFLSYGAQREDLKLHDFERILEAGAYNLKGGLQRAGLIESHLVDHFIPFLPLEKIHIRNCILAEYGRRNVIPTNESIDYIMNNYVTYERKTGLFGTSGCKRLSAKVEVDVMSNYLNAVT